MKKTLSAGIAAAVLLVCCTASQHTAAALTADVICEDFPPYFSPSLPFDGMVGEILQESFKGSGVAVRFNYVPYARALKYFKDGKYPIHTGTSAVFTADDKAAAMSIVPFVKVRWCLFSYNRPIPEYRKIEDLRQWQIGSYIGAVDIAMFRNAGIRTQELRSMDVLVKMLHYGRIDFVSICDIAFYPKARELYPDEMDRFKVSRPLFEVDGSVMFTKKHPDGERLSALFKKGFAALKSSGGLRRIVEKYYGKGKMPDDILF
jgi:polar amino acid transport system substrate-binding protein